MDPQHPGFAEECLQQSQAVGVLDAADRDLLDFLDVVLSASMKSEVGAEGVLNVPASTFR
jgi:hypothetical protein